MWSNVQFHPFACEYLVKQTILSALDGLRTLDKTTDRDAQAHTWPLTFILMVHARPQKLHIGEVSATLFLQAVWLFYPLAAPCEAEAPASQCTKVLLLRSPSHLHRLHLSTLCAH